MIALIIKLAFYISSAYILLSIGCEYRSYRGGHRYIRAFRAQTSYQRLFTQMQCDKDIDRRDMGKLTYLGYAGVVLFTVAGVFLLLYFAYLGIAGCFAIRRAELLCRLWACGSGVWGVTASLITGFDSLINRFF